MNRRRFIRTLARAGATVGLVGVAQGADRSNSVVKRRRGVEPSLRDVGWVWEGQGIDPQVPPSIYGLGQGARYFGLVPSQLSVSPQ